MKSPAACIMKFLLVMGMLIPWASFTQEIPDALADTICVQRDLPDLIRSARNKPPKVKEQKTSSLLLIPIIGSNPATGFMLGVGGQYAFKMPESKLYSLISGSAQVTTKDQYIFMLKNNIYSRKQKLFYTGDWRFLIIRLDSFVAKFRRTSLRLRIFLFGFPEPGSLPADGNGSKILAHPHYRTPAYQKFK